jgi:hypothetical protein
MHREELNPSSSTEEDAPSRSDSDFDPANESGEESQQSLAQGEAPSRGRVTGLIELRRQAVEAARQEPVVSQQQQQQRQGVVPDPTKGAACGSSSPAGA